MARPQNKNRLKSHATPRNKFSTSLALIALSTLLSNCGGSNEVTSETEQPSPVPFSFETEQNIPINRFIYSDATTISGLNTKAKVSILNGEFSIDGASFSNTEAWIESGQSLRVRHLSPKQYEYTSTTSLTVGGYTTTFSSITAIADPNQLDSDNDGVVDSDDNMPMDGSRYSIPLWLDYAQPKTPKVIDDNANGAQEVKTVDMDSDGDLDILLATSFAPSLYWLENEDPHNLDFAPRPISEVETGGSAIDAGDLDSDGDLDLIVSGKYEFERYSLAWFENPGDSTSTFTPHPILQSETLIGRVGRVTDLDNDGILDILSGNHSLRLFRKSSESSSTYDSVVKLVETPIDLTSLSIGDIDNDGDLDIVATDLSGLYWFWLEQVAIADFKFHPITNGENSNFSNLYGSTLFDIDQDGDLDLVTVGNTNEFIPSNVSWWENKWNTQQEFIKHSVYGNASTAYSVDHGDLDNDGDIDFAITAEYSGKVIWFENTGGQTPIFMDHLLSKNEHGATYIAIGDIQNNGANSIIASNEAYHTVSHFETEIKHYTIDRNTNIIANQQAIDPDGDKILYSMDGDDAELFEIDGEGTIRFSATNVDSGKVEPYDFWINASDGKSTIRRHINVTHAL